MEWRNPAGPAVIRHSSTRYPFFIALNAGVHARHLKLCIAEFPAAAGKAVLLQSGYNHETAGMSSGLRQGKLR